MSASQAARRAGVPLAVALLVLAVVFGIMRLADPPGEAAGSGAGSGGDVASSSPGDVASSSPGGGGVPDATISVVPPEPEPPGTGPPPDEHLSRFTSVTRGGDDRSIEVQFWGGVEDCYRYTVRAREGDEVVTLSLREATMSDGPCIELAQQYVRTVALDEPLGVRRVVDSQTGETLLGPTR